MTSRPLNVFELRQYTLHPGRRDELIDLFEREFIEPQESAGMALPGLFRDLDQPDRFVWLRAFPDMPSRKTSLETFYGGEVWKAHRDAANATMIDSDNVLLLRPLRDLDTEIIAPLFCVVYDHSAFDPLAEIEQTGARVRAAFASENAANNFPALPVREGADVLVALVDRADRAALEATQPSQLSELVPTTQSRMQFQFEAKPGDFAFLDGRWNVRHRKLRTRLSGANDWAELDGDMVAHTLLGGLVSVDEIGIGTGSKGCSFRNLDLEQRRWSIRWVNSASGSLFPPVHGGFRNARGEFYGYDREGTVAVLARYIWSDCATPRPRWEQAFSTDGGQTWETNWVMEFRR